MATLYFELGSGNEDGMLEHLKEGRRVATDSWLRAVGEVRSLGFHVAEHRTDEVVALETAEVEARVSENVDSYMALMASVVKEEHRSAELVKGVVVRWNSVMSMMIGDSSLEAVALAVGNLERAAEELLRHFLGQRTNWNGVG